ncbi:uncharacterized protein LOC142586263 [Dermacentor variabilis]|uniref:uncharacterized protein LOC142586263 n=1 Tax=Dermacentor variabilis TaxID=34621 RepID=UPI003F5CAAF2
MDDISKEPGERVPRGKAQAEPRPSQPTVDDPAVRLSDGASSKQSKHGESFNASEQQAKNASPRSRKRKPRGGSLLSPRRSQEDTTRRTSAVERALRWRTAMCLLLALVVAASALLFVYLLFFKDPRRRVDYCVTEDCVAHAAELLGTLNAEADPCQDFYEFACGKASDAGRSGRDPLVDRMYLRTLDAGARSLEENQAAAAGAAGSTLTAELLYQSCVDPKRSDTESSLAEFREFRAARGMRWPESPQPADGVDPLDLMLDLAINWNLNFLFDVRVVPLPTAEPAPAALVLSRGKLGYVWQDNVRRRSAQGGAQEYEGYVHEYYRVLSVAPQSSVTAATLRELEEAILAAKLDVAADESEQVFPALVALEIAFAAFKQAVYEDSRRLYDFKLPHLDAYTDEHIFFVTYCHALCGAPSARERCNVPLRHFLPFLKAFRCSRDSAMSAAEKCSFLDA